MNDVPVLACTDLGKEFRQGTERVQVLCGVNLSLQAGTSVAVVGASGCGKSTLLHLLAGLDLPSAGEVRVSGRRLAGLSDWENDRLRNQQLGFIYQFHHLLPEFSAVENVCIPLLIGGCSVAEARHRASKLLTGLGLARRLHHRPGELSGGERQRTAIARALVTGPGCILADEPTGNLDEHSADEVFEQMLVLQRERAAALLMVTHNSRLARRMQRVLELRDGQLHDI